MGQAKILGVVYVWKNKGPTVLILHGLRSSSCIFTVILTVILGV